MRALFLSFALLTLSHLTHAASEADILIAYDNGYSDSVGGNANAEVLAANAVASSNLINERSGTGARMRICGYHKTWGQAGRSTLGGYVGWMNNYSDGNLDDITTAADARGADLVAFICAPSSGETAGGTGSIGGAVTINGAHSPGTSTGTQTFGSTLDYSSSSNLKWELFSNTTSETDFDKISASGAVTIANGATLDIMLNATGSTVSLDEAFGPQQRSWTVLTGSSISGNLRLGAVSGDSGGRAVSDYGTLSLQQSSSSAKLVFTPYTPTELWRQTHFGDDWSNPAVSSDDLDSDRDGLANILEYALGTDPNAANPASAPQSATTSGKLKISFTRNSAATDLTISVMAADDIASSWTEIARSTHGAPFIAIAPEAVVSESGSGDIKNVETTDIYLITDPEHPKRFMRLRVDR